MQSLRIHATVLTICVVLALATVGSVALVSGHAPDTGEAAFSQPAESVTGGEPLEPIVIDELIEKTMTEYDVAGATVAYVEGDQIVHAEGYGYADYERNERVDPNETSFLIGSVSKTMLWTAVMQGVEDGTLDLDEPVGTYLDDYEFEGDDEITLEHLMTHSPGYEDRMKGIFARDYDEVDDWERNLEAGMPRQVWTPGETISYSNHGANLAGLVVQEAYGEPFESHIESNIFEPLGMDSATYEQPVPADRTLSKGHVMVDDGFEVRDPVIVPAPPGGSVTATAPDMANFAIAKLQYGAFDDDGEEVRILEAESVEKMFEQQATNHPGVDGIGYGYMVTKYRGETLVVHTGGGMYFHTLFVLFPEHDVGLFVSFNTMEPFDDVLDGFMEERFGAYERALEPNSTTADRADEYEGEYRITSFQTTHEKFLGLQPARVPGTVTVYVTEDGVLELTPIMGETSRWVEVEPGVFEPKTVEVEPGVYEPGESEPRTIDDYGFGQTSIAIEDGHLYMGGATPPYEQLSWYETIVAQAVFLGAWLVTLLSTLVIWPVNAYRRHGWGRMRDHATRPRLVTLGCVGFLLLFLGGIILNGPDDMEAWVFSFSLVQRLTFGLLYVLAIGTVVAVVSVGIEWQKVIAARDLDAGSTNRYGLGYLTILIGALLLLLWQAWYWNLFTAAF
ncbi:serine hydrolase domain-containing protein [Natrialbaceae archaeon A-CW3]